MKLAGRGGHNYTVRGARALVDEVDEDRLIFAASKKYLSTRHSFIDCTPSNTATQSQDLSYGTDMANKSYADIFYSIHLNKAYDTYNGKLGCEIWLYNANSQLKDEAERILKNLETLGFKNRGIKYSTGLHDLNSANMPSMIIECFFCEATEDVALYRSLGPDVIGFAIANGIDPNIVKKEEVKVVTYNLPDGFNETYYLYINPDVAEAVRNGVYPSGAAHYDAYGRNENRVYSPTLPSGFNSVAYMTCNPDVAEVYAALHYLNFGIYEGRKWDVVESVPKTEIDNLKTNLINSINSILK